MNGAASVIDRIFESLRQMIEAVGSNLYSFIPELWSIAAAISLLALIFGLLTSRPGTAIIGFVGLLFVGAAVPFIPDLVNSLFGSAGAVSGGSAPTTGIGEGAERTMDMLASDR